MLDLYSKAVEYYNGMNDDKYQQYEIKIQNMLLRPEILMVMSTASKNPEQYKKDQDKKDAERKKLQAEDSIKAKRMQNE